MIQDYMDQNVRIEVITMELAPDRDCTLFIYPNNTSSHHISMQIEKFKLYGMFTDKQLFFEGVSAALFLHFVHSSHDFHSAHQIVQVYCFLAAVAIFLK